MPASPLYPNLVDRALRYLQEHGEADEAELCAHLFGVRPGGTSAGPWPKLLRQCLAGDPRLVLDASGRWTLRGRPEPGAGLAALEFVALAVRANGPKPWRHRVVVAAALRVAGRTGADGTAGNALVGRWLMAIRPDRERRLPAYLADYGLSRPELDAAPTFAEAADGLLAFLGDRPLVGLDVALAAAFLQFELRRLGRPSLTNPLIDLAALADLILPGRLATSKPTLNRLATCVGLPEGDQIRLHAVVRRTADVGRALLARADGQGLGTLDDLLGALARRTAGPSVGLEATRRRLLLDLSAGRGFPEGPGVYLLEDESGRALYVGKAASLRQRLSSYFSADLARVRRMSGVVEATAAVETRETETELEARLLEARLIAELRPRFNVQREPGGGLVYLRRSPESEAGEPKPGRRSPWASAATEPDGEVVGPLASAEAQRLLEEARRSFGLVGRRRKDPDRAARVDEAWNWVRRAAEQSPVAGPLTGADLRLLAVLAPWPAPPSVPPRPASGRPGDGEEPTPREDDGSSTEAWPDAEVEAGERWEEAKDDVEVDDSGVGLTEEDASPEDTPEATAVGSSRLIRDGAIRVVVLGRAGWLGSLTLGPDADEHEARRQIEALAATDRAPGPTTLAELSVAVRQARKAPETVVPLLDRDTGARALLVVRAGLCQGEEMAGGSPIEGSTG